MLNYTYPQGGATLNLGLHTSWPGAKITLSIRGLMLTSSSPVAMFTLSNSASQ
ncbi:hypothetical protein DPMN_061703 [Dreissena polymorpha]|uniref:Uncharacterized protein n=1 Tax=Dreissena polymorpha TaxID=45954 RepID=A0A9D4HIP0_DREPO|nr:hypothetical protein DPMN_061703 [Dreissena polymorpha]